MSPASRLQALSLWATLHALAAEPGSPARAIREGRAQRIARAYWQARLAEDAAADRRRAAYLQRRSAARPGVCPICRRAGCDGTLANCVERWR